MQTCRKDTTFSAMGPVAGAAAEPAVPRRPRPPTRPGAQRPAAAAPGAPAAGRSDDDLRPAERAVATPGGMRARLIPPVPPLPAFAAGLLDPGAPGRVA